MHPVAVEMRGRTITGVLTDGDDVLIRGTAKEEGMLRPNIVYNLDTHGEVKVIDPTYQTTDPSPPSRPVLYLLAAFLLAVVFLTIVMVVH